MDKQLANRIVETIETLLIENYALRSLLVPPYGKGTPESVASLLETAKSYEPLRENVRARLAPLREKIQADTALGAC